MARFGTGIQAGLGRIDYTPYMQGAVAGSQAIGQGIAALGQAAGSAIRDYKQKKEEEKKIGETIGFLETNFKKDPSTYAMFDDGSGNFDRNAANAAVRSVGPNGVMTFINFSQAAQANRDVKAEKDAEKARRKAIEKLIGITDPQALSAALAAAPDDVRAGYDLESLNRRIKLGQATASEAEAALRTAQAAEVRAGLGVTKRAPAPAGYEYTQSGELRQIPGGPAAIESAQKEKEQEQKDKTLAERVRTQQIKLESTLDNINQAIALSNAGAGGTFEGLPYVNPVMRTLSLGTVGSDTAELSTLIDSIKAGVAIDEIENLKALSPTGSTGFGNLTEGERQAISSTIVTLDPSLPESALRDRLKKLQQTLIKLRGGGVKRSNTGEPISPYDENTDGAIFRRNRG